MKRNYAARKNAIFAERKTGEQRMMRACIAKPVATGCSRRRFARMGEEALRKRRFVAGPRKRQIGLAPYRERSR